MASSNKQWSQVIVNDTDGHGGFLQRICDSKWGFLKVTTDKIPYTVENLVEVREICGSCRW